MAEILTPDCWVFIRVRVGDEVTRRIAASWPGSYLWGASWRVSSAIERVADAEDRLIATTRTGTEYHLLRNRQRQSMTILSALEGLRAALGEITVEIIVEDAQLGESNVEVIVEATPENETWNP